VYRQILRGGFHFLLRVGRNCRRSRQALVLENLALRSQLTLTLATSVVN
jgi:hypothetical protein